MLKTILIILAAVAIAAGIIYGSMILIVMFIAHILRNAGGI